MASSLLVGYLLLLSSIGCQPPAPTPEPNAVLPSNPYQDSRPWTRWWWFAQEIKKEDIRHQLDWLKDHNFGGVEVAWVYPLWRYEGMYKRLYKRNYPKDTTDVPQKWLSPEWSEMAVYAKQYADTIGLGCDFTFGSAWPVSAGNISLAEGTKIYGWPHFRQTLTFGWEYPKILTVIDHLDSNVFYKFANPIAKALQPAMKGSQSAMFTDSWEVKLNSVDKIWTTGFDKSFQKRFDYDIIPFMEKDLDSFPHVRYDYMMHLSDYVIDGFYKPYVNKCHEMGALARVQCLASPTDVMEAYGVVDIPETESMLNNPNYSRIVSSAACLAGKPVVTSENFTCMYGFPGTYLREEQTADLKLVVDAMLAQGVNHIFYHGMPFNPKGSDTCDFFATVYVGPNGSLTDELAGFNQYMAKVCSVMKLGKTYTDVAAYIPYEDHVMAGPLPLEKRRVWVWGKYEMRYLFPPDKLEGYHPIWINRSFLEKAKMEGGKMVVGDASFSSLYIDASYVDSRALDELLRLGKLGLPIYVKNQFAQPGHQAVKDYADRLANLLLLPNVSSDLAKTLDHPPLVSGDNLPDYWCREVDGDLYIFFANPKSKSLAYPLTMGQSFSANNIEQDVVISVFERKYRMILDFQPYQSLLLKLSPNGSVGWVDISYRPKDPEVREPTKQRMCF